MERGQLIYQDEKDIPKGWRTLAIICGIWILLGAVATVSALIIGLSDLDVLNSIFYIILTLLPVVLAVFLLMWAYELTNFAIYENGIVPPMRRWGKTQFIPFSIIDAILVQPESHPNRYAYIHTLEGEELYINTSDVEEVSFEQLINAWTTMDDLGETGKGKAPAV